MAMNTPSPLVPQGTLVQQQSRSYIRIAVFTILAIHIVLLGALLLQGCKRTADTAGTGSTEQTNPFSAWQPPPLPPLPTVTQMTVSVPPPTITETSPPTTLPVETPIPVPPAPPPGRTTVQPTVPPAAGATEHSIAKGESFFVLAQKYGVTVKAIADANPTVDPRRLQIGQKIYIPAPSAAAPAGTASANATGQTVYVVQSGDTLIRIAHKNGTTVEAIRTANNLSTDRIVVGQKLSIPKSNKP
jgi:LysM repeat protein